MTGPRVEPKQAPQPYSPEAYDAAQPTGLVRGLSPDEYDQAQGMTPTQLKAWKLPPMDKAVQFAPRDATARINPTPTGTKYSDQIKAIAANPALQRAVTQTTIPGFGRIANLQMAADVLDKWGTAAEANTKPDTWSGELVRNVVAPPLKHPWMTAGVIASSAIPVVGQIVQGVMVGDIASNVALYGYQRHLEEGASPEARKEMEADPQRISGKAAIIQAAMLGLVAAHAVHDYVNPKAEAPMEIKANVPRTAPVVPQQTVEAPTVPMATAVADMEIPTATKQFAKDRVAYEAERVAQERADLSAERQAAADKVAQADAMRPRRRAAAIVQSEQGAEMLGTAAAQHGLPADASPYLPNTPQDVAWKAGHDAVTGEVPVTPPATGYTETLYRGVNAGNKAGDAEGSFWSPNREFARNFTESGRDSEIKTSMLDQGHIYDPDILPQAGNEAEMTAAMAEARRGGFKAMRVDEGPNQPPSVFVFAEKAPAPAPTSSGEPLPSYPEGFSMGGALTDNRLPPRSEMPKVSRGTSEGATVPPAPVSEPVAAGSGLAPVEGTGDVKARGLSAGIEAKAVEAKLTETLGDLPQYRQLSMADQAAKASDLLTNDPALARRVALGEVHPPEGILPEAVLVAVENKAIADGDVATLYDLAHGKLTGEATTMGQRIRTLGERDPESPVSAIEEANAVRSRGQDVEKQTLKTVKEIQNHFKDVQVSASAWKAFIDSLKC